MKRFSIFVFLLSLLIILSACAPVAQEAVTFPDQLQPWVKLGVEIAVVFLFTQLAKVGLNFEGYTAQVVAAITSAVIVAINAALSGITGNVETIVSILFNILVVVLGSFGTYKLYRQARPKERG